MPITTDTFAEQFTTALVDQGVALDDATAFAENFSTQLTAWMGGEGAIPADLSLKLATALGYFNTDGMQRLDWWTGPADGGPNGDGLYPMTNAAGVTTLFPSAAKLLGDFQGYKSKGSKPTYAELPASGNTVGDLWTVVLDGHAYVWGVGAAWIDMGPWRGATGASAGQEFIVVGGTAAADPGNGKIKFNHATPASITAIYVDNLNQAGQDVTAWLDSISAQTTAVRAQLVLRQTDTDKVMTVNVNGAVINATSYRTIPCIVVGAAPTFDVGGHLVLSIGFTPAMLNEAAAATALAIDKAGLADTKASLADTKAALAQTKADAAQAVVDAGATILAAKTAAETARTGAENAQALTSGYFAGINPATQSIPGAITDDYGLAVLTIAADGTITGLRFVAASADFKSLTGVNNLAIDPAVVPFSVGDEYGVGLMSVDNQGVLRAVSAVLSGLATGTLTADDATITNLAVEGLSLDSLALDTLITTPGDYVLALVDAYGMAQLVIDANGVRALGFSTPGNVSAATGEFESLDVGSLGLESLATVPGDFEFAVVDEYGIARAIIDSEGVHAPNIAEIEAKLANGDEAFRGNWGLERFLWVEDGQSLSVGNNNTAISLAQLFGSTMLSSGVRTYSTTPYTSQTLVPLVEATVSGQGETPVAGALQFINELIAAEDGIAYTDHAFEMTGASVGIAGVPISTLVKGTTSYTRLMDVVTRVKALSLADFKPFGVAGMGWTQGESDVQADTAFETYITALRGLRSDFDADVKVLLPGNPDVDMFTYQTCSHGAYMKLTPTIALAQLEASVRDPHIHLACPIYFLDFSDGVHLTAASAKWLGAYKGLAYKRVKIDGVGWKPLAPKSVISQGSACIVVFDVPAPPLRFDTAQVVNPGNYGFELVDSGGSPLTISSISLAGPDRVKIVASATLPAGFKVRYAWSPSSASVSIGSGRITGPRGCLRDSQGDRLVLEPAGIKKAMHNWCVVFEL